MSVQDIKLYKFIFITNLFVNKISHHHIIMKNNTIFAINKHLCYTYSIVINFRYNNAELKNLFIDSKMINQLLNRLNQFKIL